MMAVSSAARLAMSGSGSIVASSRSNSPGATATSPAPAARAASVGRVGKLVPSEQVASARVLHVVLDLALLEQRVHRYDHAPGPQDAVVDDGELGHVRQHDPDPVAGLESLEPEQAGPLGRTPGRARRRKGWCCRGGRPGDRGTWWRSRSGRGRGWACVDHRLCGTDCLRRWRQVLRRSVVVGNNRRELPSLRPRLVWAATNRSGGALFPATT